MAVDAVPGAGREASDLLLGDVNREDGVVVAVVRRLQEGVVDMMVVAQQTVITRPMWRTVASRHAIHIDFYENSDRCAVGLRAAARSPTSVGDEVADHAGGRW